MQLDHDEREGFGPETISFTLEKGVTYYYCVHNYSYYNSKVPPLTSSGAQVVIKMFGDSWDT